MFENAIEGATPIMVIDGLCFTLMAVHRGHRLYEATTGTGDTHAVVQTAGGLYVNGDDEPFWSWNVVARFLRCESIIMPAPDERAS